MNSVKFALALTALSISTVVTATPLADRFNELREKLRYTPEGLAAEPVYEQAAQDRAYVEATAVLKEKLIRVAKDNGASLGAEPFDESVAEFKFTQSIGPFLGGPVAGELIFVKPSQLCKVTASLYVGAPDRLFRHNRYRYKVDSKIVVEPVRCLPTGQ